MKRILIICALLAFASSAPAWARNPDSWPNAVYSSSGVTPGSVKKASLRISELSGDKVKSSSLSFTGGAASADFEFLLVNSRNDETSDTDYPYPTQNAWPMGDVEMRYDLTGSDGATYAVRIVGKLFSPLTGKNMWGACEAFIYKLPADGLTVNDSGLGYDKHRMHEHPGELDEWRYANTTPFPGADRSITEYVGTANVKVTFDRDMSFAMNNLKRPDKVTVTVRVANAISRTRVIDALNAIKSTTVNTQAIKSFNLPTIKFTLQ